MNIKLMKIIVAFVAIVFTAMNLISPAIAADIPDVVVFEHSNFQGRSQSFSVGGLRINPIDPQLSNQVSSISVPSGATASLSNNETGEFVTFEAGNYDYVGDFINDRADSIETVQDCVPGANVC
jgi:hypothetical protein